MSILKRKYRQVKRFIQFIPHIWKGADWDYRYAVDLFTYQLSRTANYIEEHDSKSHLDFVESTSSVAECGTPYFDMVEVYENNYTDKELLMIAEERSALMHESRHKQKRAHKIAWDLIEHNICGWWD